jgi:hypothetical protein
VAVSSDGICPGKILDVERAAMYLLLGGKCRYGWHRAG